MATKHNSSSALQNEEFPANFFSTSLPYEFFPASTGIISKDFATRILDYLLVLPLLILCSPFIILIVAAILITSGRPIFYSQSRVGQNGKKFPMLKFRTMIIGAHRMKSQIQHLNFMSGPFFKVKNDPRVTKIGKFLRKSSLDELPQLWNVLRGDMSLVGPRPMLPEEVAQLNCRDILQVKPGITGLWQISGRNEIVDFKTKLNLDRKYIQKRGLIFNFYVIAQTILVVIKGGGAY